MKKINQLQAQIRAINLKLANSQFKTEKAYCKAKNKLKTLKKLCYQLERNFYQFENLAK